MKKIYFFKKITFISFGLLTILMTWTSHAVKNNDEIKLTSPITFVSYPGTTFLPPNSSRNLTYTLKSNIPQNTHFKMNVSSASDAITAQVSPNQMGPGFCNYSGGNFTIPANGICSVNIEVNSSNGVGFAEKINIQIAYGGQYPISNTNDPTTVTVYASNQWTNNFGPPGGTANQIVASPDGEILYAATPLGVFISTDQAETWTLSNDGLPINTPCNINTIAVDPINTLTLYVGTSCPGIVYKSENGGTWTAFNTNLPAGTVVNSIVAGDISGTTRIIIGTTASTIYYSDNAGEWNLSNVNGLTGPCSTSNCAVELLFNPANNDIVYAGFTNYVDESNKGPGIYVNTQAGNSNDWSTTGGSTPEVAIVSLTTSADGSILYAGTNGGAQAGSTTNLYLYQTSTNSYNWIQLNPGSSLAVRVLSIAAGTNNVIYIATRSGGVYRYDGTNWSNINGSVAQGSILPLNPNVGSILAVGSNLYAGAAGSGVVTATSTNFNWQATAPSFYASSVQSSLAVAPDGTLYAGGDNSGIYRLQGINNWSSLNQGFITPGALSIRAIAISPDNGTLYSTNNGLSNGYIPGQAFYKASNNANAAAIQWNVVPNSNNVFQGRAMVVAPNAQVYAGSTKDSSGGIFYLSSNSFVQAQQCTVNNPPVISYLRDMAASPIGNYVYGIAEYQTQGSSPIPFPGGVWVLNPNQNCWTLTQPVTPTPPQQIYGRSVAVGPDGTVYAGGTLTGDGQSPVFVASSPAGGSNWTDITYNLPNSASTASDSIYALAIAPNGDVYAGNNSGVYQLNQMTQTWNQLTTQGLQNLAIRSLVIQPAGVDTTDYLIRAGTNNGGTYTLYVSP